MTTGKLTIEPISTGLYTEGQDLYQFIDKHLASDIADGDVLAISSKLISISEACVVDKKSISKKDLIKRESDHYLGEIGYNIFLTIKHGLFIPSAGVDASNSKKDEFLLYPPNPFESAKRIWSSITKSKSLNKLGVILVDSHTTPLRRGTTGIALAYWGFRGVKDYRGVPDIYNSPLEYTFLNIVDSLATSANLLMGEGAEQIPLVRIMGSNIDFCSEVDPKEVQIEMTEDLYYPIFKNLLK